MYSETYWREFKEGTSINFENGLICSCSFLKKDFRNEKEQTVACSFVVSSSFILVGLAVNLLATSPAHSTTDLCVAQTAKPTATNASWP